MTEPGNSRFCVQNVVHNVSEAIASAVSSASNIASTVADTAVSTAEVAVRTVVPDAHNWVERGTETVGRIATPIAENPLVKGATQVPGLKWLLASLGQVSLTEVRTDVAALQQQYPAETPRQLARRIISDTAMKAAGIGLATNIAPPIALGLLGIEIAAISALQAGMIYRIAAVYGFELEDPARRGEVMTLWGVSSSSSGVVKAGVSLVEAIPFAGPAVSIGSNASLLYGLGYAAVRFYENKLAKGDRPNS
ncbi:hypothetical protein [Thermoleptolyngbya sp. M55_K2018_002]|uniref:hypothetical protein n=1 Tax=Thermoleptolyngbya sp. M55_K2018_002 TaxID=2747808 RepID=UPI0025E777F6|nr:hypothetical protein [Thermoleptolyngbya sp. M55_K2018_002]